MKAWIVFLSAYMVAFLAVGVVYSVGNIFVDIMETFNATRAETSVIHSTALGIGPGSGVLAGILVPKFGIRKCSLLFATFTSFGVMSCYLASSIWHMALCFGVIYGLGFTNICSTAIICRYFTGRRRLLVLSLQGTGAALGGIVYPYCISYLSAMYGFRGALLIIGAICLNCIPACLLWKDPTTQVEEDTKHQTSQNKMARYQDEFQVNVICEDNNIVIKKGNVECKSSDIFYIQGIPVLNDQAKTKYVTICKELNGPQMNTSNPTSNGFISSLNVILKYNNWFCLPSPPVI